MNPFFYEKLHQYVPEILKSETVVTYEVEFAGHYFLNTCKGIAEQDGSINSFILFSKNITEAKKAELNLIQEKTRFDEKLRFKHIRKT